MDVCCLKIRHIPNNITKTIELMGYKGYRLQKNDIETKCLNYFNEGVVLIDL